jgi:hypothetical protein
MKLVAARSSVPFLVLAFVACGGAPQKPAESVDTSSLESSSSPSAQSKPSTGTESTEASTPTAKPSAPAAADPPATPAANHPVPAATGSIDGKPFSPKLAQISGPKQKDGRVSLMLHEGTDCVGPGDAKPGDASMVLVVPWKDGYKTDVSALARAKKGSLGEAAFVRIGDDGKKQVSTTFKPTGRITVVSAPTEKDATGKVKIDLQSGDYMVAGDLDVKVCAAPK